MGEGGGQILRTALSLSLCLQRPIRIRNIRSQRHNPGLRRQHLVAVEAAKAIGRAEVSGASLGSRELFFSPHDVEAGTYHFDIGTAGSTGLVLQTLLPALITAGNKSELQITGGTHNPLAPSFDYLKLCFIPLLERMGPKITLALERHGFYPAGGGVVKIQVEPTPHLQPLHLLERGKVLNQYAVILLSHLPEHIAQRESRVIAEQLDIRSERISIDTSPQAKGPGNAVIVVIESEHVTEVFSGFGQRGIRAETVAERVALEAKHYFKAGVPVGGHLADQLLLPLALAGGGSFVTLPPSRHTLTNIEVLKQFLSIDISCTAVDDKRWMIQLDRKR